MAFVNLQQHGYVQQSLNATMLELEDSLEEFDIRYVESCNQIQEQQQQRTLVESEASYHSTTSAKSAVSNSVSCSNSNSTSTTNINSNFNSNSESLLSLHERADSLSTQTKRLTLSSPLLATKEIEIPTTKPKTLSQTRPLLIPLVPPPIFVPIFSDYEISPTNKHAYTMRPPMKPDVTITSIETLQRPAKFRSQSLNLSPLLRRHNSAGSLVSLLISSRRATISQPTSSTTLMSTTNNSICLNTAAAWTAPPQLPYSRSASVSVSASVSASGSVGNPFYRPKKDTSLPPVEKKRKLTFGETDFDHFDSFNDLLNLDDLTEFTEIFPITTLSPTDNIFNSHIVDSISLNDFFVEDNFIDNT